MINECYSCGNAISNNYERNICQPCRDDIKQHGSNYRENDRYKRVKARVAEQIHLQGMNQSQALAALGVTEEDAVARCHRVADAGSLHHEHKFPHDDCHVCHAFVQEEVGALRDALSRPKLRSTPLDNGMIPHDIIERASVAAGKGRQAVEAELVKAGWRYDMNRNCYVGGNPTPVRWIEWVLGFRKSVTKTDLVQAETVLGDWSKKLEGSRWR